MSAILASVHWIALLGGLVLAFGYFRALGDVTQAVFNITRDELVKAAANEHRTLAATAFCALAAGLTYVFGAAGNAVSLTVGLTLTLLLAGFPWLWVHVGLRGQQENARFYSPEQADGLLDDAESVLVLEVGGRAWAFPDVAIRRPHIAGLPVPGGTILTYCALSKLGIAVRNPLVNTFSVVGQFANNLILRADERCLQQMLMGTAACAAEFEREALTRMSWRSFRAAFPAGSVYLNPMVPWLKNPLLRAFDEVIERVFNKALHTHHHSEGLMFETMDHEDRRLPRKTLVWGIVVDDDAAAFTEDYVRARGVVNTRVGHLPVVLAFDETTEALVAFARPAEEVVQHVDFHGNSSVGQLVRVTTLYPGMYWFAWVNFFPQTTLDGVSEVPHELGHLHEAAVS